MNRTMILSLTFVVLYIIMAFIASAAAPAVIGDFGPSHQEGAEIPTHIVGVY